MNSIFEFHLLILYYKNIIMKRKSKGRQTNLHFKEREREK
jgi:hypothetical protein